MDGPEKRFRQRKGFFVCLLTVTLLAGLSSDTNAVIISSLRQCINKGTGKVTESDCQWRSHTNVDVRGGELSTSYVLRKKDNPNSGLYIHIQTAITTLTYNLVYQFDAPYMYREHNGALEYSQVAGMCDSCDKIEIKKCTLPEEVPPKLKDKFVNKTCCICGKNVPSTAVRQNLKCSGWSFGFLYSNCVSLSCLEIVGPWYSIYKPQYPPDINRRIFVDVYSFDGDAGIIPDVSKKGYQNSKLPDETRYLKEPVYKDGHLKFTMSTNAGAVKNEDLDVKFTIISQQWVDGNAPIRMDKYVAVPTWPDSHPDVQGSSLRFECQQADRPYECRKGQDNECRMERCALNVRVIEPSAVDVTGATCDKIGVSMGTWGDEKRLCNQHEGTCIQNQLAWYFKEFSSTMRLPKLYGSQPMIAHKRISGSVPDEKKTVPLPADKEAMKDATFSSKPAAAVAAKTPKGGAKKKKQKLDSSEWEHKDLLHSIAYNVRHADTSRIEIDSFDATMTLIIAEAVGFIVSVKPPESCTASSEDICTIKVVTKNAGKIRASFSHRVQCYDGEAESTAIVATADERFIEIDANGSDETDIPIKLMAAGKSDLMKCRIALYSSTASFLESVDISMGVKNPEISMGKDTRSLDSETMTHTSKDDILIDGIQASSQCNCTGFAVVCFFSNFKSCMSWAFNKYYAWFILGISVLSFLVLLPALIPLGSMVIGKIKSNVSRSRAAAAERKREQESRERQAEHERMLDQMNNRRRDPIPL
ncbi:Hook-Associated Protein 2 (HAP2) [Babesia bovis T2Bo]|uniref:Membrane protein, putative n=1 Tax=Babesia bovis TaxID=5865 RepID=A7ANV4_BABBO|nr:Hook-Associated Protein 2 (HAP2) [Babesia bovis T2Bo]EDO08238.1 Hook-Associated Protein 2 (HAP2) [Babesia bovis T2Bo]|eukprot:XP_001611806.1 membrane protein [Babesia bovis T2Bo]